jgi:hypothetical protein
MVYLGFCGPTWMSVSIDRDVAMLHQDVVLTGQLGQVHCPEGQLQVPEVEHPQSLMVKSGCEEWVGKV